MIQNNQAVMLAIVPRTFTAQDLNGVFAMVTIPIIRINSALTITV